MSHVRVYWTVALVCARLAAGCYPGCDCSRSTDVYCGAQEARLEQLVDAYPNGRWPRISLALLDIPVLTANNISVISNWFDTANVGLQFFLHQNNISLIEIDAFKSLENINIVWFSLEANKLRSLSPFSFKYLDGLTTLSLKNNEIYRVQADAFANLHNLKTLVLEENSIRDISVHTLQGLENLETLDLRQNNVDLIRASSFDKLTKLKTMHLQHNKLTTIPSELFAKTSLEHLNISSNELCTLNGNSLPASKSLHVLDISKNKLTELKFATCFSFTDDFELRAQQNLIKTLELALWCQSASVGNTFKRRFHFENNQLSVLSLSEQCPSEAYRYKIGEVLLYLAFNAIADLGNLRVELEKCVNENRMKGAELRFTINMLSNCYYKTFQFIPSPQLTIDVRSDVSSHGSQKCLSPPTGPDGCLASLNANQVVVPTTSSTTSSTSTTTTTKQRTTSTSARSTKVTTTTTQLATTTTVTTTTTSTSPTSTELVSSTTKSNAPADTSATKQSSLNTTAIIAGAAAGGAFFIFALTCLGVMCCRSKGICCVKQEDKPRNVHWSEQLYTRHSILGTIRSEGSSIVSAEMPKATVPDVVPKSALKQPKKGILTNNLPTSTSEEHRVKSNTISLPVSEPVRISDPHFQHITTPPNDASLQTVQLRRPEGLGSVPRQKGPVKDTKARHRASLPAAMQLSKHKPDRARRNTKTDAAARSINLGAWESEVHGPHKSSRPQISRSSTVYEGREAVVLENAYQGLVAPTNTESALEDDYLNDLPLHSTVPLHNSIRSAPAVDTLSMNSQTYADLNLYSTINDLKL